MFSIHCFYHYMEFLKQHFAYIMLQLANPVYIILKILYVTYFIHICSSFSIFNLFLFHDSDSTHCPTALSCNKSETIIKSIT